MSEISPSQMRKPFFDQKAPFIHIGMSFVQLLYIVFIILLTLVPIINIYYIVMTMGVNNLSSDDYVFVERMIDPILSGTYNWLYFFQDCFYNTHFLVFPSLIYLLAAYFFNLNEFALLSVGIILAIVRIFLIHNSFTHLRRKNASWWLLYPILAAQIFSTSQISLFEHGPTSVAMGLCQFGLILGVWGLTRFPKRDISIYIMVLGGTIATFSFGSGLGTWPIFLLGLLLLKYTNIKHYIVWFSASVLTTLPYVFFLFIAPLQGSESSAKSLVDFQVVLQLLGLPLTRDSSITIATISGAIGLVVCVIGLFFLWARRHTVIIQQASAALMLLAFGLLGAWQISIFRGRLAPWYSFIGMAFWIGLVGIAYTTYTGDDFAPMRKLRAFPWASTWSILTTGIFIILYAYSNITYRDKSLFLRTRSPASAACLQNYRIAPTYCENTLVIWTVGSAPTYVSSFAKSLERHHLSVFAPDQRHTLQGDFILDQVSLQHTLGIPSSFWSADQTPTPTSWDDYHHLNLFLHAPNTVSWTITLPSNLQEATFSSAIQLIPSISHNSPPEDVTFEVYLDTPAQASTTLFSQTVSTSQHQWQPFSIPLSAYTGKKITLRLGSSSRNVTASAWEVYQYPHIDLKTDSNKSDISQNNAKPFVPRKTNEDVIFDLNNTYQWMTSNLKKVPNAIDTWIVNGLPTFIYQPPLDLCAADYSHFYIQMAASQDFSPRAIQLYYKLDGQNSFDDVHSVKIPLKEDEGMHTYTYDLKLLGLDQNIRLSGIGFHPVYDSASSGDNKVQITDFRLIRAPGASLCQETSQIKTTAQDTIFDLANTNQWLAARLQPTPSVSNTWTVGLNPVLVYQPPLSVCTTDYPKLYVRMAASPDIELRTMQIFYRVDAQPNFDEAHSVRMPLFADGALHDYIYDLENLRLAPNTYLTGIRLDPVVGASQPGKNQVQIADFRLIRAPGASLCQETSQIKTTAQDTIFDLANTNQWLAARLQPTPSVSNTWTVGLNPVLVYQPPLSVCTTDYPKLYVRMAASPDIELRTMQIFYRVDAQPNFDEAHSVRMPLFADGALHDYIYDLENLRLAPNTYLTGIRLDPVVGASQPGKNQVQIADFRLIRAPGASLCQETSQIKTTAQDITFDLMNNHDWLAAQMQPTSSVSHTWTVALDPALTYQQPLNICIAEYSQVYLRMAVSTDISLRTAQLFYQTDSQVGFDEAHSILQPLFADGDLHEYVFDLKALKLDPHTRLIGLRIDPIIGTTQSGENQVQITDFHLIHSESHNMCQ